MALPSVASKSGMVKPDLSNEKPKLNDAGDAVTAVEIGVPNSSGSVITGGSRPLKKSLRSKRAA